jgi:hypothetical protein
MENQTSIEFNQLQWSVRIDEANPVGRIAQVGLSGSHVLENPLLAFHSEILSIANDSRCVSNEHFTLVGIKLVTKKNKTCIGISLYEAANMLYKVRFRSCIGKGGYDKLACGKVNVGGREPGSHVGHS